VAIIQSGGQQMKIRAPEHRMSTLQDLNAGRPLEVEETIGYAIREAARLNLSLPLLQNFYSLVAGIDRSRG
jgi:2-dehydropantoate 2-reductase